MKNWKKILAVLVVSVVFFAGCIGQSKPDADGDGIPDAEDQWPGRDDNIFGKTLTVMTIGEPETLDPAEAYDSASWEILENVYDRLVDYDYASGDISKVVPSLAERWEVSSDGLVYTFYLRKNVKFSNGNPLTADDVVFTFKRTMKLGLDPSWMLTDFVESVEKVDDYTVRITLVQPYGGFLFILANPIGTVLDKEWCEENGITLESAEPGKSSEFLANNAMGTGPYMLQEWTRKERIVLVKNPNYWKGWEGKHLDTIIIKEVDEVETRIMALKNGDADIVYVPQQNFDDVKNVEGVLFQARPDDVTFVIMFGIMNPSKPPFDDVHVRRAFSYAFDYQGFINSVIMGYGVQATGVIPKGMNCYTDKYKYTFDLEKAKQELAQSKYAAGGAPPILILYNKGNDTRKQAALILADGLKQIGLQADIQELDWPTLLGKLDEGEFHLIFIGWGPDYNDPDDYVWPMLHTDGRAGVWGVSYENPDMDELIMKARAEQDMTKRCEIYEEILKMEFENPTYLWLYQPMHVTIRREWLKGVVYNPITEPYYYYWYKENV